MSRQLQYHSVYAIMLDMTGIERSDQPQPIEVLAQEGLELARSGDFSERFQEILHTARDGSFGMTPQPEGLALKALYHQSRKVAPAEYREFSALDEIEGLYRGVLSPNVSTPVTPMVIESLALLLSRASKPGEQEKIANALEAAGAKLRDTGYTPSQ